MDIRVGDYFSLAHNLRKQYPFRTEPYWLQECYWMHVETGKPFRVISWAIDFDSQLLVGIHLQRLSNNLRVCSDSTRTSVTVDEFARNYIPWGIYQDAI